MGEALKFFFDRLRVERIADEFARAWPAFPRETFRADASTGLDGLELLDRARHIAEALARALPPAYEEALPIVLASLGAPLADPMGQGMEAFHHHPHAVFVERRGLGHPEPSLAAMREITRRSSCEFAIRPFIERYPALTLPTLERWTRDPDERVRRLVSEGTRPRLPWAARLAPFQADPSPVLALLEKLKDDPSAYVRRSVANNLNDVAKDHPEVALAVTARWLDEAPPERRRLVLHALRGLVRAGHPEAIRLAGGEGGDAIEVSGTLDPPRPRIGSDLRFAIVLTNKGAETTAVLALRVRFPKSRGHRGTTKTFKLPTKRLAAGGTAKFSKTVSFAPRTTRRHRPGLHEVDLVVNGVARPFGAFELLA
ncbi:MAG TPA: DNA alkylation repair protein [Candidatus Thermoplasmatota archaeon]|nr:DNA alkylation repair protein [Candidatus Thermoplasmatota archaeon]